MTVHDRPFGRYLEDFVPGDVYRHWPGKTITEYDDHLFCMITMNHHPLHTNEWFAENETVHGRNVVVGNLVYSLVLGHERARRLRARRSRTSRSRRSSTRTRPSTATRSTPRPRCSTRASPPRATAASSTVETKGFNQDGVEVCYFRRKVMVWKREAAPQRKRPYDEARLGRLSTVRAGCVPMSRGGDRPGRGRRVLLGCRRLRPDSAELRPAGHRPDRRDRRRGRAVGAGARRSTWRPAPGSSPDSSAGPGCGCTRGGTAGRDGGAAPCARSRRCPVARRTWPRPCPVASGSVDVVTVGPGVPLVRRTGCARRRRTGCSTAGGALVLVWNVRDDSVRVAAPSWASSSRPARVGGPTRTTGSDRWERRGRGPRRVRAELRSSGGRTRCAATARGVVDRLASDQLRGRPGAARPRATCWPRRPRSCSPPDPSCDGTFELPPRHGRVPATGVDRG